MEFIADFHIHSKYSRATAENLDLEHIHAAAQIKGIDLVGTGDFTHPNWWHEIQNKLIPAEEGLFTLQPELCRNIQAQVPSTCRKPVRFMLVTEISNIYKQGDRTRKNHNLVFMPDLVSAERFIRRLEKIGNIRSDGRPILGLSARNLLEIVLEISKEAYLIPAHVWTPWFSLLGSKSGFDAVEECFGDLSEHIFAIETGLSSDPAMNRRVSSLDRFTLVSNSDAHSPAKLGREANILRTEMSYTAIRRAIDRRDSDAFSGTIEFYPEEGKYHLDGHRNCRHRSQPHQTRVHGDLCPVCGKPVTLGVLYRVESLADRTKSQAPNGAATFQHAIPLEDILGEVFQTGSQSKKVIQAQGRLIQELGPELVILRLLPLETIARCGIPLLTEAIQRMRTGKVHFDPGYDGQYGTVRLFDADERLALQGQSSLFCVAAPQPPREDLISNAPPMTVQQPSTVIFAPKEKLNDRNLNAEQQEALAHGPGPLIIQAGPGTGKTRTITHRMAKLIREEHLPAGKILALTFTNKAAEEMRSRLAAMLREEAQVPLVATFHGLGWLLMKEVEGDRCGAIIDDDGRKAAMDEVLRFLKHGGQAVDFAPQELLEAIVRAKQQLLAPRDDLRSVAGPIAPDLLAQIYETYQTWLEIQQLVDFEDLIFRCVRRMQMDPAWCDALQRRFSHVFVDEFQDLNDGQYGWLRLLAPDTANICVIGDPDQAIYGFRGSDAAFFRRFQEDYPNHRTIRLSRNYRSTETILSSAGQVIRTPNKKSSTTTTAQTYSGIQGYPTVTIVSAASAKAEAVAIGKSIESMVGGTGYHALNFGQKGDPNQSSARSFNDFAILYRTGEQGRFIAEVLENAGLPCQRTDREKWLGDKDNTKLLALLRLIGGTGTYADLDSLKDLHLPSPGSETIESLKRWGYAMRISVKQALQTALRLPLPGISINRQQRLVGLIRRLNDLKKETEGLEVAEAVAYLANRMALSDNAHREAVERLIEAARPFGRESGAFLSSLNLKVDTDLYRDRAEKIALLTMHAAKGLEFPVVFIAGCEEDLIPFRRPGSETDLEEERRLFYVAMTRAGERLFLSWARKRIRHGRTVECRPSPFLNTIDTRLKEEGNQRHEGKRSSSQAQLSLF